MTFDPVYDGSSTSKASSTTLDLERIQHFAAMSLNELHEHWDLSCTSHQFSRSQKPPESKQSETNAPSEDQNSTTMNDTQTLYSAEHIPTVNNDASLQTTDPISTVTNFDIPSILTATASQPQPAPTRIFRQRQPIQLQPFTEDRKQYHFLIGRKERLASQGGRDAVTATTRTSPTPQSFSEYDPSYADHIPSDGEYSEYDDSDGFVGDLDVDDVGDLSQAPSIMDISQDYDNGTGSNDDDEIRKAKIRKKRRIVIMDDSDDGLDNGNNNNNNTTMTQNSSTLVDNNKRKAYDIFAIPSDEDIERQLTHKRPSTAKNLITYGRKKKTRKQHGHHKPSTSQKSDTNTTTINSTLPKPSSAPTQIDDPAIFGDIFDIESLDNSELEQQSDRVQENMDDDTNVSGEALLDFDDENPSELSEISTATLPTTPISSTPTSIRQTNHGSVRKKARNDNNNDDDDGFIVDDDDYGHEKRRRNTTLREIRKNKRHLRGILPTSFTRIYQKQLDEEENDKHRRPSTPMILPAIRNLSADGHENDSTTNANNDTGSEYWEIEATALDDDDDVSTTPSRSIWASGSRSSDTMNSRRYEEEQRSRLNENLPMDCGVRYLRCDAASITKLTYLGDGTFSLFNLHQHPSFPTSVLDQPFADSDYFVHSLAISNLFDSAYQTFDTMWTSLKDNDMDDPDKNTPAFGLHEKNMSLLLGFLRFVSICLSKGYQNNKNGNDGGGESDKVASAPDMQEFLIGEMDNLADRIVKLVKWKDGGVEMTWLKNGKAHHGSTSPLLLVLVYFVEWSYQIHKALLVNPLNMTYTPASSHWTLKTSLRRLLRYLLSLGPLSVSVEPVTGLLFHVSEPRVMESWVLVLQMMKLEDLVDSTLWPSLQEFMEQMEKSSLLENAGNIGDDGTVWNKVEVTWKWVLTLASLQRMQKDDAGFGKVKATEFNYNSACWSVVQQLLREVLQQKTAIGNLSMTDKTLFRQFRSLTFIRLTFCRCHYLLTNYNWMWDSKTLQHLYDLAHIPQLQVFTGDPIHPQQYHQQQDRATAAKYFPHYFTNYDGTIPDNEISPTDTCGVIFLKILSYGLRKRVDMILKSSSGGSSNNNNNNSGDINIGAYNNEHRENLQTCLARVMPAYLVAGDVYSGKSSSFLLYSLVSNPASSLNQGQKVNPLVTFSYDYSINMAILHATARLGSDNNVGLGVFRCNFEFHTRLETEKACAVEITLEAHRIYENIKKKWGLA